MSHKLYVPARGERVRIVAIGPGDSYATTPEAIGVEGTVENAEPSNDADWLWLEFGGIDRPECWCFLECRVEPVAARAA
ncbi:MAG TPA: hypothetical protein VG734_26160 [Lacunisphaera sp.]|nr:hypothetical protein [Lacunisphaera sp.]